MINVVNLRKTLISKENKRRFELFINTDIPKVNYIIQGKNGSGKSTFVNLITGNMYPDLFVKSQIRVFDYDIFNDERAKKSISFLPSYDFLLENVSIKENILLFCELNDIKEDFENDHYKDFKVFKFLNEKMKKLSDGERQSIKLYLILSKKAKLYILDEPLINLDKENVKITINIIKTLIDEGKKFLIISHQYSELNDLIENTITIDDGKIIEMNNEKI